MFDQKNGKPNNQTSSKNSRDGKTANLSVKNSQQENNFQDQSIQASNTIQKYIEEYKELYENLLILLEKAEVEDYLRFQITKIKVETRAKLEELLQLITIIANNHHRGKNFIKIIFQIIEYFKDKIKQTFSNIELFNIFQNNKKILHFLFKNEIIIFDEDICNEIISKNKENGYGYCHFFYPEIKKFNIDEIDEDLKKELSLMSSDINDQFEEKREKGENDTYICSLIRNDSVKEFISHVTRFIIPLNSEVKCSIFETNSFLIENKPTLIEYSAFYGSIQIFRFLIQNNVELKPSIWLYSIHSQNAELIHLLESLNIDMPIEECLIESIKCHHNNIATYIEDTLISTNRSIGMNEAVLSSIFHFHNYKYFPSNFENSIEFFYLCCYDYNTLVNLFMQKKEETIKKIIVEQINMIFFF